MKHEEHVDEGERTLPGHILSVLKVCVGWSPWVEAGLAEAELLRACLLELEKQGWEAR